MPCSKLQCHEREPGESHTFLPEVTGATSPHVLFTKASHMATPSYQVSRKREYLAGSTDDYAV